MVGDWTEEEADVVVECIEEIFEAVPKTKRLGLIGELNEALVFVGKAKAVIQKKGK